MVSMELQIAQKKIRTYESDAEDIIHASREAQDCMECEDFLDQAILALTWIERAESSLIEAASEGLVGDEEAAEIQNIIASLHEHWLRPCALAKGWVQKCIGRNFEIRNLAEFNDCCERAQDWIERNENYKLAKAAREERFAQEEG